MCVPAARMAETPLLLLMEGMRSTMYSHSSLGRRSPNGTGGGGGGGDASSIVVVGPSGSAAAAAVRGYKEKVSSWLRAKMKSSFEFNDDDGPRRNPARWIELPWLWTCVNASSGSGIVMSWIETRASVLPDRRSRWREGWKVRVVTSSWDSV